MSNGKCDMCGAFGARYYEFTPGLRLYLCKACSEKPRCAECGSDRIRKLSPEATAGRCEDCYTPWGHIQ